MESIFKNNLNYPVYRWFYFTEGYSKDLVSYVLDKYIDKKDAKILDPFCGTGTTLLYAKEKGYKTYGFDISPLMYLVTKAKTKKYNIDKLNEIKIKLDETYKTLENNISLKEEQKWIKKFFYSNNLNDLLKLKSIIETNINNYNDFFMLLLIKTMQDISRAEKVGSALKLRKIREKDTKNVFDKYFNLFIQDLNKMYKNELFNRYESEIYNSAFIYKPQKKFDAIICSPPYLNKTEYTRRMGLELVFLDKDSLLKNHMGTNNYDLNKDWLYKKYFQNEINLINENNDYKMSIHNYSVENYFKELELFVENAQKSLNTNGILSITIAGGCFKTCNIDLKDYLIDLYEKNGLSVKEVKIDRMIQCHKDRTQKTGQIPEFTIIGKK